MHLRPAPERIEYPQPRPARAGLLLPASAVTRWRRGAPVDAGHGLLPCPIAVLGATFASHYFFATAGPHWHGLPCWQPHWQADGAAAGVWQPQVQAAPMQSTQEQAAMASFFFMAVSRWTGPIGLERILGTRAPGFLNERADRS